MIQNKGNGEAYLRDVTQRGGLDFLTAEQFIEVDPEKQRDYYQRFTNILETELTRNAPETRSFKSSLATTIKSELKPEETLGSRYDKVLKLYESLLELCAVAERSTSDNPNFKIYGSTD